jgi:glucosamine--fructose-6-phosphate aminotransferase (isomerizing)
MKFAREAANYLYLLIANLALLSEPGITVIDMPHVPKSLEAIIYTLPLQMLSVSCSCA